MHRRPRCRRRTGPVLTAVVLAVFLALAGAWAPASAEDSPPPPPTPPLERLFAPLKEMKKDLPPFFRDADLKAHFRLYYFNRLNPNDTENEALAFGGWLALKSGWLLDTLSIGATLYGSAPEARPRRHRPHRHVDARGLRDAPAQAMRQGHAAGVDPNEAQLVEVGLLLDDLVADARERSAELLGVEEHAAGGRAHPALAPFRSLWTRS